MKCPTCGQPVPGKEGVRVSPRELDAASAYWWMGSVKAAADLCGVAEQTLKNELYNARIRNQVDTTRELCHLLLGQLRSMAELRTQHKTRRRVAA